MLGSPDQGLVVIPDRGIPDWEFPEQGGTRRGGGGPVYAREHSKIEAHRNSFFPSTTRLYNNLPVELRLCTDMDEFAKRLSKINLVELRNSLSSID